MKQELAKWLKQQMHFHSVRGLDIVEAYASQGITISPSSVSNLRREGMSMQKAIEMASIMGWNTPLKGSNNEEQGNISDNMEPSSTHLVISFLQLSSGNSLESTYEVLEQVKVSLPWLQATYPYLTNPSKLALYHIKGDSMEPTFSEDDTLLVDTSAVSFDVDGAYVFAYHDELLVKRIQKRPGQGYVVISDNREFYDSYPIPNTDLENVRVLAKVVGKFKFERI